MRICSKCEVEKEETEFFYKNKRENILHSYCKNCKRELDRKAYTENKTGRADRIRENAINQIRKARAYVLDIKKDNACSCGESRWWVLDFHHLQDKNREISDMVRRGASIKAIQKEINKCIILCSNCHRDLHYREENMV